MRRLLIALLVASVVLTGVAVAQTLTGTVSGSVMDEQGGVLPGVTVTLTGRTGSQTQVTDARGEFRFIGLAPGPYSVKAELQGFRPREQQNLDVSIGRTVEVPLQMAVGGLTESVEVVANAVTVDTTTASTDTAMSQDLLFSMPLSHNNPGPNIVNYSPGVNDGSAFGGASDGGNALMLDGVDTRDPEAGTSWAFYNFNIIEEVQVGSLGQPAEYGGFTGAVVNTITKSGGNRFSQLSEYRYTSEDLAGDNTKPDITAQNRLLGVPPRVLSLNDYTVQLGGPLKKDQVFFFGSVQRYQIEQQTGALIRGEISPRFNLKLTYQPTPNDNLTGSIQYDQYNQKGRTGLVPSYAIQSNDQTVDQDSPEYVWNGQYRKVFGASTFLEAKYIGWSGYYDLNPVSQESYRYDLDSGLHSGGAGYWYQADRNRNQVNLSLSRYAQAAGEHNFKFGAEIERSTVRNRFAYSNDVYYVDYAGEPYLAYGYSYDVKGKNTRESFYAQDHWKVGQVTANLGVRADRIGGIADVTGEKLYSTFSVAPRLGVAIDVTGRGTSVLRGFYGQMYESAVFTSWKDAVPGYTDFLIYEVGPNWGSLTEIDRIPAELQYRVSDDLKHPRVDEFNVAWEQQVGRNFKLTATGIFRDWKNFINAGLIGGAWQPTSLENPLPGAPPLTIYRWANRDNIEQQYLIQNVDSLPFELTNGDTVRADAYRKYRGLMLVFQRALRNRWQAQVSYVLSKTEGTVGNGTEAGLNSNQFETPNTILLNAEGPTLYDRRHEVKLFAGYQIPVIEVSLNGHYRYLSGYPYAATRLISGREFNWPSSITLNLDAPGAHQNDSESRFDLRAEKVFSAGIHRFGVYVDVENLFNQSDVLSRETRYPNRTLTDLDGNSFVVDFGAPRSMQRGRQATVGLRWSF